MKVKDKYRVLHTPYSGLQIFNADFGQTSLGSGSSSFCIPPVPCRWGSQRDQATPNGQLGSLRRSPGTRVTVTPILLDGHQDSSSSPTEPSLSGLSAWHLHHPNRRLARILGSQIMYWTSSKPTWSPMAWVGSSEPTCLPSLFSSHTQARDTARDTAWAAVSPRVLSTLALGREHGAKLSISTPNK